MYFNVTLGYSKGFKPPKAEATALSQLGAFQKCLFPNVCWGDLVHSYLLPCNAGMGSWEEFHRLGRNVYPGREKRHTI